MAKPIIPRRTATPPNAAAMPIPAFAPVERPDLFAAGAGKDVGEGDGVGVVEVVTEMVEDCEVVDKEVLETTPIVAAITIAPAVSQHAVLLPPQHHFMESIPPHGLTFALPLLSYDSH